MLGFKNATLRPNARGSLTVPQFFARYPALHPFLLSQLRTATCSFTASASEDNTREIARNAQIKAGSVPCHPVLHPLLVFLTRLRPVASGFESGDSATLPLDPFRPLLAACAGAPPFAVRELAARAYCALVTQQQLRCEVAEWFSLLPAAAPLPSRRCNAAHGALCVLRNLVAVNLQDADAALAREVLHVAESALHRRLWLADVARTSCPGVSRAFVQLLATVQQHSSTLAAHAAPQSLLASAVCAQLLPHVQCVKRRQSHMPFRAAWLQETSCYLLDTATCQTLTTCAHHTTASASALQAGAQAVKRCLSDTLSILACPTAEVQAEALRCLIKRADWPLSHATSNSERAIDPWVCMQLWSAVSDLAKSTHPKVQRRACQLLTCLARCFPQQDHQAARKLQQQHSNEGNRSISMFAALHIAGAPGTMVEGSSTSTTLLLQGAAQARLALEDSSDGSVRSAAILCMCTCLGRVLRISRSDHVPRAHLYRCAIEKSWGTCAAFNLQQFSLHSRCMAATLSCLRTCARQWTRLCILQAVQRCHCLHHSADRPDAPCTRLPSSCTGIGASEHSGTA